MIVFFRATRPAFRLSAPAHRALAERGLLEVDFRLSGKTVRILVTKFPLNDRGLIDPFFHFFESMQVPFPEVSALRLVGIGTKNFRVAEPRRLITQGCIQAAKSVGRRIIVTNQIFRFHVSLEILSGRDCPDEQNGKLFSAPLQHNSENYFLHHSKYPPSQPFTSPQKSPHRVNPSTGLRLASALAAS